MFRVFCFTLFVALLPSEIYGRPSVKSGLKDCFSYRCPENTFACSKRSTISDDRKEIISEISCLDLHNNVLDKTTTTTPNIFGEHVIFQGYSYKAAYEYSDDDVGHEPKDVNSNTVDVDNDVPKKESGGVSEVDDLNKDVELV